MEVNGKFYGLWGNFVQTKERFIGKTLEKFVFQEVLTTKITNITLAPNGTDSAFFEIVGTDFSCCFDVNFGGITSGDLGWITFAGYGNQAFRIKI